MTAQQTIFALILTELGNISTAEGDSFTADGRVYEWRDSELSSGEYPAVIVRDITIEAIDDGIKAHRMTVETVFAAESNTAPADLRAAAQDILSAFQRVEENGAVAEVNFQRAEFHVEKAARRQGAVLMYFAVDYYTEPWSL